jgi:molecular chaperone GrpE (heat shock protein)
MNKLAEKISSIMTDDELIHLVDDHYQGEAQLLTTGTEANLLKLAEIREVMTEDQQQRWRQIKSDFMRNKAMGGDDADTGSKIVVQLNELVGGINAWRDSAEKFRSEDSEVRNREAAISRKYSHKSLSDIAKAINQLVDNINTGIEDKNQNESGKSSSDKLADVLENTLQPLVRIMNGKLDLDLGTHENMSEINRKLDLISKQMKTEANWKKSPQSK